VSSALTVAIGIALAGVLVHDRLTANGIALSRDAIVGALFALLLYALRCMPHEDRREDRRAASAPAHAPSWIARPCLALAGFGYTLYLVHEPPLAFLREWIIARPHHRWTPTGAHLALGAAIVIALVAYAYAISRVTEARTDRVRAWLQRRLAAWHPSLAPATHRLAAAAERIAPAPTWQTTAEG